MKNYLSFILSILFIAFSITLEAQNDNIRYGILLEYDAANINLEDDQIVDFTINTSGIALGILAEAKVSKSLYFGIQPKIFLGEGKYRSATTPVGGDIEITEGYLEVQLPLYLSYALDLRKVSPRISAGYSFNINVTDQDDIVLLIDQNNHTLFAQLGLDVATKHFVFEPYIGFENGLSNMTEIYNSNDNIIRSRKLGLQAGVKFKGPVL